MAARSTAVVYHLFLLLSTAALTLSAAATTSDGGSLCKIQSPAPGHLKPGNLSLFRSYQLNAGYFFGGEDIHFSKDDGGDMSFITRSISLLPLHVDKTTDSALIHVAATLQLSGGRNRETVLRGRRRERYSYVDSHSVYFYLDGYHDLTSGELCMSGSGTYTKDDGSVEHLLGVVLDLRVPSPSSLQNPFISGRLKGDSFEAIFLVGYAEDGAYYKYAVESASCPAPPRAPSSTARALNFSCPHVKQQLVSSYRLQHGHGGGAQTSGSSSGPLLRPDERRMHVSQVRCTADGQVRAYVSFSNDTAAKGRRAPRPAFMVKGEVVVAEGHWDPTRSMLCLRACRTMISDSEASVSEKNCSIGIAFWFPAVWNIRDRSSVAGMLWNSSQAAGSGGASADVISVWSIDDINNHRGNFSDVKYGYNYTMIQEAKKQYTDLRQVLSDHKKGSFLAPNYTYRDFEFEFYEVGRDGRMTHGHGSAYPVTIGSATVYGDRLAADDSFSRHAMVDVTTRHELLNVSYHISESVPASGWTPPKNKSWYSIPMQQHDMTAEGVFDPKTGILCMIACREVNVSTADCKILLTFQFPSLDAYGGGKGAIKSLRSNKTDDLFFEKIEIGMFNMYSEQVLETVSRMDLESIMLVASTTLPCVFTALQIFHVKRNPEAAAAMSVTMLAVMALGYVAPLVLSSEALFMSRRQQYVPAPFRSYVPYELSQAMMRAPTLIALLLQLRLIQLAWAGRKAAAAGQGTAERRALWVCMPMYLLGGALTVLIHVVAGRRAALVESLAFRIGPEPASLWEDLVSTAGLALDAFLLPQVAMNAFSGGAARARALSPWFYVGGTVARAAPHVYDVIRARGYVPTVRPSYVYASPRDDRFGLAWDVAVPCGAALLAAVLFLQQRTRLAAPLFPSRRRSPEYELVSGP